MLKRILILSLFLFLYHDFYGQLKKIEIPGEFSETDYYNDPNGNTYSTIVRIKFFDKVIDLRNSEKIFSILELTNNSDVIVRGKVVSICRVRL